MAWPRWTMSCWRSGSGSPAAIAQLPLDQIQPGDLLGDRMLHLQAGIDFHEVETTVLPDDELHRAGVGVVDRVRGLHRRRAHRRAQLRGQERRGRFFQHLLVAPLRRAFALAQVDGMAVDIAEDLDLDVARMLDVALQQHAILAEGVLRLALAAFEAGGELACRAHDAHALAAAAMRGLDHQRIADAVGFALQQVGRLVFACVARHHRHAGGGHQVLGAGLAAHLAHGCARRADEGDAGGRHRIGEVRVLGQEAVAGVDRLRAGFLRHLEDGVAAQVAVLRARAADAVGFVRQPHVLGIGVGLREHRHGADAQLARGTDHAAGDLAAVGDEDGLEHQASVSGRWQTASMLCPSGSSTKAP